MARVLRRHAYFDVCNAGALATAGYGTALGVIRSRLGILRTYQSMPVRRGLLASD